MAGLVMGLIAGLLVALVVPPLIPEKHQNAVTRVLVRAVGVLIVIFAIASTSYVHVPDGYSAHLFRVYAGGSLPQ